MGFESYDAFMSAALSLELEDRAKRIGVTLDSRQQRFLTMVRTIAQIKQQLLTLANGDGVWSSSLPAPTRAAWNQDTWSRVG